MNRREFNLRSLLLTALFVIGFVVAVFVDMAGVLQYFDIVSGASQTTLVMGAAITATIIVPFLAMGMSISVDRTK
jgi:hypothetical protein